MVAVDPPSNNNSTKTQACLVDCEHLTQIWAERRGHAPSCETDQNHPVEIVPNSAEMNSLKKERSVQQLIILRACWHFPLEW